jgi:UDPglucose 6-dehydrogenase
MNITIVGHGHLAYITAACMEQFHKVNVDETDIEKLQASQIIWICYDTPVDADGKPSSQVVVDRLRNILPNASEGTIVLVSSQIPVGTCRELVYAFPKLIIACSPENLRRGKAINDFMNPDRIIVGLDGSALTQAEDRKNYGLATIEDLFAPLNKPVIFVGLESAEMIKHAINSFLALSIAFINEISEVCDATHADKSEVSMGLQSDKRIGPLSYLKPGGPYTNDTLGREIHTLIELDKKFNLGLNLIPSIKKSNDERRNNW